MYRNYVKRLFDLAFAIVLLPVWALILVIVGPMIYFEDRGPVFYNAPRLGRNGKVFIMYKFRSMKVNSPDLRNADGSTFNAKDDPRLTRIGRFLRETSIDETPQILNVIKGDMSLIGPRPDLPDHIREYDEREKRKLEVRPGITGYNQVYYRNSLPWKERLLNDVYYVDHLSFLLDLRIFLKTITSVFKRDAVFIGESSRHE